MFNDIKIKNLNEVSAMRDELSVHPKLRFLFLELTDRCNLNCLHCGSSSSCSNSEFLPKDDIKKLLLRVKEKWGTYPMICVTGGEPMLHPDFYEIAELIHSLGFSWGMTTNGTLIIRESVRKLKASGIGSITVSMDGLKEEHEYLRGAKGSFDAAVSGIKCLLADENRSFSVQITTVVHKKNIDELDNILRFVQELGADSLRVINMEPIGRALEHPDLLLDGHEFIRLLDYIREKRFDINTKMDVCYGCSHYLTPRYEHELRDNYYICGSGILVASVLANGDIFSCLDIERRPELIQGNIKKDDFVDVFENRFEPFRRNRGLMNEKCRECEDLNYCRGDSGHTWDYSNNRPIICFKEILKDDIEVV